MASPQAIADACTYLTKVYGERAKTQLGDDLAKELLFEDLKEFTDLEVKRACEMMRRGQENVFADGQSIYAIILKWAEKARVELHRENIHQNKLEEDARQNEEMKKLAREMTAEKMAINKLRIQLLAAGKNDEAARLSELPEREQLQLVPRPMLLEARRIWKASHEGHFSRVANSKSERLPAPSPCPMIPERTGGQE